MKNYYEILEVDKNASQEVIEKAYRALAKKYHPDLQQGPQQQQYAEKMKIINQAYDVLSNSVKREKYNQEMENELLERQRIQAEQIAMEQQERMMQENYALRQQLNQVRNNQSEFDDGTIINMSRILSQQINQARKQAYQDAYIQDLRNRGYKIKYKHGLKYYLKTLATIALTIFICFLIYQIPPVKNFFARLYNNNVVFKVIVDIINRTFSSAF